MCTRIHNINSFSSAMKATVMAYKYQHSSLIYSLHQKPFQHHQTGQFTLSAFCITEAFKMPTTEPTTVFHRSLWTVLNKNTDTVLSQLTRSLSRQMLYFVP